MLRPSNRQSVCINCFEYFIYNFQHIFLHAIKILILYSCQFSDFQGELDALHGDGLNVKVQQAASVRMNGFLVGLGDILMYRYNHNIIIHNLLRL